MRSSNEDSGGSAIMKVIITGATGFIGRNLAEQLHKDQVEVVSTGRSLKAGDDLRKLGITFLPADLRNQSDLVKVIPSADCLIHCAGKAGDGGSFQDFYDANVISTRNVISACQKRGISKIVFVSTPCIYFTGKDRINIQESEPLPEQTTKYGHTKLIAERELLALPDQGYKVIILRPRAVFGPYDNTILPTILSMAAKKRLPLINGGKAWVDLTYIDNFVDLVRTAISAPENAWNQIYNVSNGEPIQLRDWFARVLAIFQKPFRPLYFPEPLAKSLAFAMEKASLIPWGAKKPLFTRFSVGYLGKSMTLSIEKAIKVFGYAPIGNDQGFARYAQWYRTHHE